MRTQYFTHWAEFQAVRARWSSKRHTTSHMARVGSAAEQGDEGLLQLRFASGRLGGALGAAEVTIQVPQAGAHLRSGPVKVELLSDATEVVGAQGLCGLQVAVGQEAVELGEAKAVRQVHLTGEGRPEQGQKGPAPAAA